MLLDPPDTEDAVPVAWLYWPPETVACTPDAVLEAPPLTEENWASARLCEPPLTLVQVPSAKLPHPPLCTGVSCGRWGQFNGVRAGQRMRERDETRHGPALPSGQGPHAAARTLETDVC